MYLLNGQLHQNCTLDHALSLLLPRLPLTLARPCTSESVMACLERFARHLARNDDELVLDDLLRAELIAFCQRPALNVKLEHDLGVQHDSLRRIDYRQQHFEGWRPLGLVLHVTPGNASLLPFYAVVESLLVGNINWLRPSSGETLSARLLSTLIDCDADNTLADFIAVLPVAKEQLPAMMQHVDGVSAWGGDSALQSIRRQLAAGCRWIEWGHRISFAYVTPDAVTPTMLDALIDEVCRLDQQACSSPQLVLVDSTDVQILRNLGEQLAQAFSRRAARWPAITASAQESAEITTRMGFAMLDQSFTTEPGQIWSAEGWRVVWQHRSVIEPSPLFRSLLLRPLARAQIVQTLLPWRTRLQSCALICTPSQSRDLIHRLLNAGVTRITPPALIHLDYPGEPHDGVQALSRFARRVSVTLEQDALSGHATLDSLPAKPLGLENQPLMDKTAFRASMKPLEAKLFFRSGGSSGTPTLSGYSYRDYQRQMRAGADGLFAAGLDPANDRVMNLLYGGKLYGGLMSFSSILEKLGAVHYPMGGALEDADYGETVQMIVSQRVDTLIGNPSLLHALFLREEKSLRNYGGIRKLLMGGEHMARSSRHFIESFGVSTVRSAIYGTVDAGPVGHACSHTAEGTFHLMSEIQWLEIIHPEHDTPVAGSQVGRFMLSTLGREGQTVQRYDVGDSGCWVEGPCPCGLPTPRFELHGRHGDLIRTGGIFISPTHLATLAETALQLTIEHDPSGLETLTFRTVEDADVIRKRLCQDKELAEAVNNSSLVLHVESCSVTDFQRNAHSGKAPQVIDLRTTS